MKRSFRVFGWPRRLKPVTTSTVAKTVGRASDVDILLVANDDPFVAANSDKRTAKKTRSRSGVSRSQRVTKKSRVSNRNSRVVDKNTRDKKTSNRKTRDKKIQESSKKTRASGVAAKETQHRVKRAPRRRSDAQQPVKHSQKRAGFFKRLLMPREVSEFEVRKPFWRRWFYSIFFFLGMLIIWVPVISYVTLAAPVYNSSWTILIPGTQVGASIDLLELGEAYTDVKTPYGGNSFSPGVNFKKIMSSVSVLTAAAERVDMTVEDFGMPKITVTDQAATLEVVFSSDSAESAQEKSTALYEAFQNELTKLRKDEVNARRAGSNEQLDEYRDQADLTRDELAKFRDQSTVVSVDQYRAMVNSAGMLEQSLIEARVDRDAITSRLASMAETLGVDAYRAADVMLLRQDKLVQALSTEYARLQALFIEQASVLGAKHPKVVHARAKANAARQSMINRVRSVVGEVDEVLLSSYLPDPIGDDGQLYKDVVTFEAERESLNREITSSEQLLAEMRGRIAVAGTDLDQLEELERNHQMAATILVSATSNLDLGRSNIYATYPLTQVLVEPTLPDRPKKLLKILALLGGILGSGFLLLSLIIVKYRDRWRRLILKNA